MFFAGKIISMAITGTIISGFMHKCAHGIERVKVQVYSIGFWQRLILLGLDCNINTDMSGFIYRP